MQDSTFTPKHSKAHSTFVDRPNPPFGSGPPRRRRGLHVADVPVDSESQALPVGAFPAHRRAIR
jgi:hypothetical protein